jgi:hypothetical protein
MGFPFVRTADDDQVGLPGPAGDDQLDERFAVPHFILHLKMSQILAGRDGPQFFADPLRDFSMVYGEVRGCVIL